MLCVIYKMLFKLIQYWKKTESERKIKVRCHGVGMGVIKFHYDPDLPRITLNIFIEKSA